MTKKIKYIWWIVVFRGCLIAPFVFLELLGDKLQKNSEKIAEWLNEELPDPVYHSKRICPECDGFGESLKNENCINCSGAGWIKND